MRNFEFLVSTKIIFGKDTENKVGSEVKKYGSKILLHYGGKNIKNSGLYDRVVKSLKSEGIEIIEYSGVLPNPRLDYVKKGIEICRENKINFVLAVGGGSVIDSAKAICAGVPYKGDVWDFYSSDITPSDVLPFGVIATIAASGSETSTKSVLTNENGFLKRGMGNDLTRAKFAILNPELTTTLPPFQSACGIVDIMAHVMERYFTNDPNVDYTDRLCEATLKTVIENASIVMNNPLDYNARAEIMFAGAIAHNDFLSCGRNTDWGTHMIEHELSGIYDVAHGAGLAVIFPAWMKHIYKRDVVRFAQYAVRVWNCDYDFSNPEKTALEGISRTEAFYKSLGMPSTLSELGIHDDRIEEMAKKCRTKEDGFTGGVFKLDKNDIISILRSVKDF